MAGFIADCLEDAGYQAVLAHYEPYSVSPQMSVPSFKLLGRRGIRSEQRLALGSRETHAVGAWLPELEFTHYLPTRPWRALMASCSHHLVVCGNILAGTPYLDSGRPFLCWIASGWEEDRKDRVSGFSTPRKMLDRSVNGPVLRRLERRLLRQGHILALSGYTGRTLDSIAGEAVSKAILPMPIDTRAFVPRPSEVVPWRIGFSGRIDDPRKNVELLLAAAARLVADGRDVTVDLIGGEPGAAALEVIDRTGLRERVRFWPYLPKAELAARLRSLDVYVVASHQEGLCIAALEAMASGCPVVSTHCGGPQDYVVCGVNGDLVDFDASEMAAAIARCAGDRDRRARLAHGARSTIEVKFEREAAAHVFWQHFHQAFGSMYTEVA